MKTKKTDKKKDENEEPKKRKNLNAIILEKLLKEGKRIPEIAELYDISPRTVYNKIETFNLKKILKETKTPDHSLIKDVCRDSALLLSLYINKKLREDKFLFPSEVNFILNMNKSDGLLEPSTKDNGIMEQIQSELQAARKDLGIKDEDESDILDPSSFLDTEEEPEEV